MAALSLGNGEEYLETPLISTFSGLILGDILLDRDFCLCSAVCARMITEEVLRFWRWLNGR